jgi:hypothetical protein
MSIIVVNLQDNRAVFQIFIKVLRFSVDCPSYFLRKFPVNFLLYLILLQKKSDPVVRSPVYEAPEIFRTSDFFLPDENSPDS